MTRATGGMPAPGGEPEEVGSKVTRKQLGSWSGVHTSAETDVIGPRTATMGEENGTALTRAYHVGCYETIVHGCAVAGCQVLARDTNNLGGNININNTWGVL